MKDPLSTSQWEESVNRISSELIGLINKERGGTEVIAGTLLALKSLLRAANWEDKPSEVYRLEAALLDVISAIDEWRKNDQENVKRVAHPSRDAETHLETFRIREENRRSHNLMKKVRDRIEQGGRRNISTTE